MQFCHSLPHVESSEFIDRPRIEALHLGLEPMLRKTIYPWWDFGFFNTQQRLLYITGVINGLRYQFLSLQSCLLAPIRACFFSNSCNGQILKFWILKSFSDLYPKIGSPTKD